MFRRRMRKLLYYVHWLSVYMTSDLTLRALVEGSQLPSVTWEQSGIRLRGLTNIGKGNVMKRIWAVIVFFAAATSLALGQATDKQETTKGEKADVEQSFLQMERDGNEATVKKDVATLSEILADEWIGQNLMASKPKLRLWQTSNRRAKNSIPLTSRKGVKGVNNLLGEYPDFTFARICASICR
jgi:hypothetical protein